MLTLRRFSQQLCQGHLKPLQGFASSHYVSGSTLTHFVTSIRVLENTPRSKFCFNFNYDSNFTSPFRRQFCSFSRWNTPVILQRLKYGWSHPPRCLNSTRNTHAQHRNRTVMLYVIAGTILVLGFSYAAVPLYSVFCQATGLGGEVKVTENVEKVGNMSRVANRPIVIRFNADTAASMRWNFKPQQSEIKVYPGETALAFYSAINPSDKPIIGISTYNVVPFDAGQYFNKIQCFCFEEQRLNPHEQVDMPVFFFIDPEFVEDPKMSKVDTITLSYTFFEAKEGLVLPDPFAKP